MVEDKSIKYRGTMKYKGKCVQLNRGLDLIISAMTTSSMDAFYCDDMRYLYNCTL